MVHGVQLQRGIHQGFYFFKDVPIQNAPEATTLLTFDKVKDYPTPEILQVQYNYGHTPFNHILAMANNGVLTNSLDACTLPVCASYIYGKATKHPRKTKMAGPVYMLMYWSLPLLESLHRRMALSRVNSTSMYVCLWIIILTSNTHI